MATTFTIDDTSIESKYTSGELKMQFLDFLRNKDDLDQLQLYSVSVEHLSDEVKDAYENIDSMNFIKR